MRGDATEGGILLGVRVANNPKAFAGRLVIHELGPRASTRRKYFGALLVGFYEGKKLKFAGRVGNWV